VYQHTQAISLGQKLVHVHYSEKHLMEQVVYNFGAKKNTKFFVTVKGNLVFSIIVTTRCWSLLMLGLNTHMSSVNMKWFTVVFPTVHPTLT